MAYERYTEDDPQDDPRLRPMPVNQTQPVSPYRPGSVDPRDADPASGYGAGGVENPAYVDKLKSGLSSLYSKPSGAANPIGGSNTGVTGGANMGTPTTGGGLSPMSGGAMARYGTGNIPGAEKVTWGDTSGLRGFNTNEWGDGGTEGYEDSSIKNTFGKIATRYPHNADGLRALMQDPDFVSRFPEARILEHPTDPKIDFGDGNPVDVLFQSDQGWQWGPENEMGGGGDAGGMGGMAGGMGMPDLQSILSGSDPLTDIIKRIEDLQGGGTPDAEQQALIEMIRGGNI